MKRFQPGLWISLLAVGALRAQEPAAVRQIELPSLDPQAAARLMALDRRLQGFPGPGAGASLVSQLVIPFGPLDALTPIAADPRHHELWERMADVYLRMMHESGDALVALPDGTRFLRTAVSSSQVRRLCWDRLALLPRASLAAYRDRVDAEARALFELGRREHSAVPLRRIVAELRLSDYGDDALDLLGDLAFERGRFDEAEHWWRLLGGTQAGDARAEAKQILAAIFAGRLDDARTALAAFDERHPKAAGKLAGHDDLFSTILSKTLASFVREGIGTHDEPWTTFGGEAARRQTLTRPIDARLGSDESVWRIRLPSLTQKKHKDTPPGSGHRNRQVAFHPIIVNHQVLLADHRSVVGYQLATGKELFRFDLKSAGLPDPGPGLDPAIALPRFTLSADRDRAYVRLGGLRFGPGAVDPSWLVCIDLTEPERAQKRELWRIAAKAPHAFEGSPLMYDGRVYAALSKLSGRRVATSIVCYDLHGRRVWSRDVCDCPEFEGVEEGPRHRQHLLAWANGQIVYASHSGAIVAVDAWSGQPTWAVRYPSRGPRTAQHEPSPRDLAPCLAADGCVIAAPLDSDRVFCIDAISGQVRWEIDGIEVVHLVGVAHGRLLATTKQGLIAIHLATGHVDWMQPSDGRVASLGRGLIAGDTMYWPTQDFSLPYRAVDVRTGRQAFDPSILSTLPVGNWAFGEGCLAIAGENELVMFRPGSQLLPPVDLRPQTGLQIRSYLDIRAGRAE